jgi:hypothetical protein
MPQGDLWRRRERATMRTTFSADGSSLLCWVIAVVLVAAGGCGTRNYCFQIVDAESGESLAGVSAWSASSGHYFGLRPLSYEQRNVTQYPMSGPDGVIEMPGIPSIDGVGTAIQFEKAGYNVASTSDRRGTEPWILSSFPEGSDHSEAIRQQIPSALAHDVVQIPLRKTRATDSDACTAASRRSVIPAMTNDVPR